LANFGVFSGIVKKIGNYLFQPHQISFYPKNFFGYANGKYLVAIFNERQASFHSLMDDSCDLKRRLPKVDLAVHDARYIEQVIDYPSQTVDLSIDHLARPVHFEIGNIRVLHDLEDVSNRREGIAEFMAEHGEKFVLTSVCIAQGLL